MKKKKELVIIDDNISTDEKSTNQTGIVNRFIEVAELNNTPEVAKVLKKSQPTITRWRTGANDIDTATMFRYLKQIRKENQINYVLFGDEYLNEINNYGISENLEIKKLEKELEQKDIVINDLRNWLTEEIQKKKK